MPGDGSSPNDSPSDSATDAALKCDPVKAFGTPAPVPGLSTAAGESGPHLSPDELTIYFGVSIPTDGGSFQGDMFVASRSKRSDPFGTPTRLAIDSNYNDWDPSVSADGLSLFYGFNDFAQTRVWFATRTSTLADFTGAAALAAIASSNTADDEGEPFVSADGQSLWFISTRSGGQGKHDIYLATKSGQAFANPLVQSTLSSSGDDATPTLSTDGLVIYIGSDRTGTLGAMDVWRSVRTSTLDSFPAPTPVSELNTNAVDEPAWISPDNCRLYMTTTRAGNYDIYMAERAP